jgi:ankyrin repeat protein
MKKAKSNSSEGYNALLKAANKGDLAEVRRLIASGVDVNACGKNEPVLFAAIVSGKHEVIKALLDAGTNINKTGYPSGSSVKHTPLSYAIYRGRWHQGSWEIAQLLIAAGADMAVNHWGDENAVGQAAHLATKAFYTLTASEGQWLGERRTKAVKEEARVAYERWMQFVRDAIGRGIKVRDYWLWNAINCRHDELALLLISAGVNPDAAPHGSSALVRAIEHDRDDVALALIKAGANPNLKAELAPLLVAVQKGSPAVVSALLDAGADINAPDDVAVGTARKGLSAKMEIAEASTALIVATRLRKQPLVELLLTRGADVNFSDKHGVTALGWAQRLGHTDIAAALRRAGAGEPEFLEGSLHTALWTAARQGEVQKVEGLLKSGAAPDKAVEDREGKHIPLVSAARGGHLGVVELLLRNGANVNTGATENWSAGVTPLMAAARLGHLDVVKALLSAGADVHAKDRGFEDGGETALHYAARGGHVSAIEALVEAGAKINAKAKGGTTPLIIAVSEKKRAALRALLKLGADANAGPNDGSGPLYMAALEGDVETLKFLLENGAQPIRMKKAGFNPLEAAASKGSVEMVQLLLAADAPVDAPDVVGNTALSNAALYGHAQVVDILLKRGANPKVADRDGFTPLMGAARSGNPAVVQMLLEAGANVHASATDGRTALKIARETRKKEILSLLEAAAKDQPVALTPKQPARKAKAKETGDEEFEAPDFSAAAQGSEFQACVREVEKLSGTKPGKLADIEGGYSFALPRAMAEKLIADHHQRLRDKGAYLFRHERDHRDTEDKLGLLPTREWTDLIRAFQTNGANYDLTPADIARWLENFSVQQPVVITGVGWDWLEGRITGKVANARKLAQQMYEFCPDIVDQGVGSVKDLARALEKDGCFFFWWD